MCHYMGKQYEVTEMRFIYFLIVIAITTFVGLACSSGNGSNITQPVDPAGQNIDIASHQLWGFYQFTADPVEKTLDAIPLRTADLHLNALPFLEPPPLINLTIENLQFNGNMIEVDIGLRHPFLGLNQFTGFDVCGIFITNGSLTGFDDSFLRMAGEGDTRLLNPDGLTRWWNPNEFPVNTGTIFAYNDGLLGAPDSFADYNCTINGYKYFCDDLDDPADPLDEITLSNRGLFSAGQKNVRHYILELGTDGLIFNYAIDANWIFPSGEPPWDVPNSFGPDANRPEAYRLSIHEIENTLFYEDDESFGGKLFLLIDVYDWSDPGLNIVTVEAPSVLSAVTETTPYDGGLGYSTYMVDLYGATPDSSGPLDILISVEDPTIGYGNQLPGENVTAYFMHTTQVSGEVPPPPAGNWLISQGNIGHTGYNGNDGPLDVHDDPTWTSAYIPPIGNALSIFLNEDTAFMSFAGAIYDTWFPTIAVNLVDGSTKWTHAFHEETDYYTQPKGVSEDGSIVLVCEVYSPLGPDSGIIAGLDAEDGSVVWQHSDGSRILVDSYATLDLNGNFIVALDGVGYRSINPTTGVINWTTPANPGYCTPAVGTNGRIYGKDGSSLQAYDPIDGTTIWYEYPNIGSSNFGITVNDAGEIIAAGSDGFFCFLDTGFGGAAKWSMPYSYCPYGSAAVAPNGDIYFMDDSVANGGLLIRLDSATGAILNSSGPWGHAGTRPAIGDSGLVYVNTRQHIRVFNPDCTLLWEYYGGSHNHFAAPALAEDGTLYSAKKELGLFAWKDE